jgi:uncharacterized membrane protein
MSEIYKLNLRDVGKALLLAVISAVLVSIKSLFDSKGFAWTMEDLQLLVNVVITTGLSYIIKNFLTSSDGRILGRY